jgi:hypothetical protein
MGFSACLAFESSWGRSLALRKKKEKGQAWWCISVIPELGRLRQEDLKFEARVSYMVNPCLK